MLLNSPHAVDECGVKHRFDGRRSAAKIEITTLACDGHDRVRLRVSIALASASAIHDVEVSPAAPIRVGLDEVFVELHVLALDGDYALCMYLSEPGGYQPQISLVARWQPQELKRTD